MSVVTWLRVRVLRLERGTGSVRVSHRIGHVVVVGVSIPGGTVDIRGRARAVVVLVRAVFLTGVETWIASAWIGLGLALLA
jgi:hypothetical protein